MSVLAGGPASVAIPASEARWCILRMAGPSTMRLVGSLQDAGLAVWTPTEHIKRRVPRGKVSEHRIVPLAPTYAFARACHLPDLQRLTRLEVSPHPRFSIFHYYGETVFVRHHHLHPLRERQQDSFVASLPKSGRYFKRGRGEPFVAGDEVTFSSGPMAGIRCFVQTSDDRVTTLNLRLFGRTSEMQVDTLQLRSPNVLERNSAAMSSL